MPRTRTTSGASTELFWFRGRHSLTIGGGLRWRAFDVLSQRDARSRFGFTGSASGSDRGLAPRPTADQPIAFGNPDKALRRTRSALRQRRLPGVAGAHAVLGVRWNSSRRSPRTGRLVDLDVATGFTAAQPVIASERGPVTGASASSLVQRDFTGI
jgi:hypothetical protein